MNGEFENEFRVCPRGMKAFSWEASVMQTVVLGVLIDQT